MSAKELNCEKNIVTIEIDVPGEDFQAAIKKAYNRNKGRFMVQGFRKGKAPRKVIEARYGQGIFYEDAIEFAFPDAYKNALDELSIEPATRPEMDEVKEIGEDGAVFVVKVGIKPEITLKDYKGAEINALTPVISDDDIQEELVKMQNQNARIINESEEAAKDGDTVVIDYAGTVDGEPFAGGSSENYELELGSKTFIPGFEEQLVGVKGGDEKDVEVTFPEEYHAEDLKDKDAVFKVTIKEVKSKELPELDDEFAKDVSEFDTLDELKNDIKERLSKEKESQLKAQAETAAIDHAVNESEGDIPYLMIDEEVDRTMDNYGRQMQGQGISLDDYFKFTGTSPEDFKNNLRGDVEKNIKAELVLAKVAEEEALEPTEEELDEKIKYFAELSKQDFDEYKETMQDDMLEYIKGDLKRAKAIQSLIDGAVVKEVKDDETEEEA